MATQEVTLRPGDSISLLIDVPGQPLHLEMKLTEAGVALSSAMPVGAPTLYGGPVPVSEALPMDEEPIDLDAQFAAEDAAPAIQDVQSLAAVEPFDNAAPAPAPEAVEMEELVEDEVSDVSDDDLDLGDIDDDDLGIDIPIDDDDLGIDIPADDDDLAIEIPADDDDLAIDIPADDDDLGIDIPADDDDLGIDIPADDDDLGIDIPADDDDLGLDIPADDDDLGLDEPAFVADGATMLPPTQSAEAEIGDEAELAEGKEKHHPNQDDTLPVWKSKASSYKDPELETRKKATGKIPKKSPSKKPPIGKPSPTKPTSKLPGKKGALPGKKGALPGKKGPLPGKKGPLPGKKGTGTVAPPAAAGGTGNFTVFLSPPRTDEKKTTAAELISEVQGIDIDAASTLAGKMIIKVINGVSEDEAQGVRDKFKAAGLSCRITKKR